MDFNDLHKEQGAEALRDKINAAAPVDDETRLKKLATLSAMDYDRARKQAADDMGVNVTTLDKEVAKHRKVTETQMDDSGLFEMIKPWHEEIDAEKLLDDIQALVRYYIICNTETAIATTLWIAFTWFVDQVQVAPIAMITAPEKRCGKSQLLDFISRLSSRPLMASNISPAAIFRVIEAHCPTLLIDEADTFLKENEEARGIINSGHTRRSAHVIRLVGDNHESKQFSTWGAKAICGIGKQADTLMDRSVVLELRRKKPDEVVKRLRHAEPLQFEVFKQQLARLSIDAAEVIKHSFPALPEELNDRAQDNWEPLLAIADYAGGHWPETARRAALKISGEEEDSLSISVELLRDIQEAYESRHWIKTPTADLISELCEDDLKPWCTFNKGKWITPRQLARRLSEYNIKPKNLSIGTARLKGYEREQFEDAWLRYIPPSPDTPYLSATPLLNGATPYPQTVTMGADKKLRSGNENLSAPLQAPENKESSGVADKTPPFGEEEGEVF